MSGFKVATAAASKLFDPDVYRVACSMALDAADLLCESNPHNLLLDEIAAINLLSQVKREGESFFEIAGFFLRALQRIFLSFAFLYFFSFSFLSFYMFCVLGGSDQFPN